MNEFMPMSDAALAVIESRASAEDVSPLVAEVRGLRVMLGQSLMENSFLWLRIDRSITELRKCGETMRQVQAFMDDAREGMHTEHVMYAAFIQYCDQHLCDAGMCPASEQCQGRDSGDRIPCGDVLAAWALAL